MDCMVFRNFICAITPTIEEDECDELFETIDDDNSGYIALQHIIEFLEECERKLRSGELKKNFFLQNVYTKIKRASTLTPAQLISIKGNLPSHQSFSFLNKYLKKGNNNNNSIPTQSIIPKTNQLGFGLENVHLNDDLTGFNNNGSEDDIQLTIKLDRCNNMMDTKTEVLE